ncbi:MauE/DoxX family redox-associated membrane protein [Sphaerisporangium sp. NPDC049003]|uniref:MauE/DoxX family redox-associated membrane protein n=1 Tax=Sphaerisporangium sp. NPDC049003 TaxID=3364517 RepID=UPI003717FCF4
MHYIDVGCRALIALVFIVSATSKLRGRERLRAFAESLPALVPVRAGQARSLAPAVALAELAIVPLVVTPFTASVGCVLAFALLAGFTVAIAAVVRRGRTATCRCFGPAATPIGRHHLVRNGLFMVAALGGAVPAAGQAHPGGLVVAVVAGLAAGSILIRLDDLVALYAAPAVGRNKSP